MQWTSLKKHTEGVSTETSQDINTSSHQNAVDSDHEVCRNAQNLETFNSPYVRDSVKGRFDANSSAQKKRENRPNQRKVNSIGVRVLKSRLLNRAKYLKLKRWQRLAAVASGLELEGNLLNNDTSPTSDRLSGNKIKLRNRRRTVSVPLPQTETKRKRKSAHHKIQQRSIQNEREGGDTCDASCSLKQAWRSIARLSPNGINVDYNARPMATNKV